MFTYYTYMCVFVRDVLNFKNCKPVQKHTHIYIHIPHMPQTATPTTFMCICTQQFTDYRSISIYEKILHYKQINA